MYWVANRDDKTEGSQEDKTKGSRLETVCGPSLFAVRARLQSEDLGPKMVFGCKAFTVRNLKPMRGFSVPARFLDFEWFSSNSYNILYTRFIHIDFINIT